MIAEKPLPRAAQLSRRLLLHALPLVTVVRLPAAAVEQPPPAAVAVEERPPPRPVPPPDYIDPLFGRLRNRYILMRPGETTFEAADIVDSNPINKQNSERGLTSKGREQVARSVDALRERGITSVSIYYDNGARATQTADIVSSMLSVPRASVEPEFRWLEARGLGELEGTELREAAAKMRRLDAQDIELRAEPTDDGTPADSVLEVFSRLRNTIAKIENSFGGGNFIIIGGDAAVLSIFAAAACGVDLRTHHAYTLRPGEFFDLRELVADVRAGRYEPRVGDQAPTTAAEIEEGRRRIRELGPKMFADTDAGSWVLGPGVRR